MSDPSDYFDALPTNEAYDRAAWMSVLAGAPASVLSTLPDAEPPSGTQWLRRPETGLVMVRARSGGTGGQFNLGEMAATRCAVRMPDGTVGIAYVRGRDTDHATRAAVLDARLQQALREGAIATSWARWIAPLIAERDARRACDAARVETTRVNFFTVVRGEDE